MTARILLRERWDSTEEPARHGRWRGRSCLKKADVDSETSSVTLAAAPPDRHHDVGLRRHAVPSLLELLLGGSAYETHLAGAWFFGMPGGLFGSIGSSLVHPPIYAVIAVYGGMILLVRVWIGLLRHLSSHRGVPVRKVVARGGHLGLAAPVWRLRCSAGTSTATPDKGRWSATTSTPTSTAPGSWARPRSARCPIRCGRIRRPPYGPTFLSIDGVLDKASGHRDPAGHPSPALTRDGRARPDRRGARLHGPPPRARSGAGRRSSAPAARWS